MNQDQYAALVQKFIAGAREVSQKELKVVEAKANLTGYQTAYVTGPYVSWETAEAVAGHENEVAKAEKALREAREDLSTLKASLVTHLPVKNIGVLVPLKHVEDGPSTLRVKAVPREDNPGDYTVFIDGKEY